MAVAPGSERNVLVVTGIAHAATHFAELTYPTLAVVLARETGEPLERVLAWSFTGYLLFGLGALPAGLLADRFGARRMVLVGLAGMSVGLILAGLAQPGMGIAASLALVGLAASTYHPAGMGLISRSVALRGRALGVNGIFGNVGIALTPLVTEWLGRHFGWRGAFLVSGGVLLGLTAACAALRIDEPPPAPRTPGPVEPARRNGTVLALGLLGAAAMLGGISYRGNTLAQPAYFAERVSLIDFGLATSLVYLVGIAGQYVGGRLADRYPLRWSYLAFHAASLPALMLVGLTYELPLLAVTGTFVFFSLGMQPIENSLFAQLTPERWRSTGYGLKFILSFGIGSVAVWMVRGAQAEWGLAGVFPMLAVVVATLVVVTWLLALVLGRRAPAPGLAA